MQFLLVSGQILAKKKRFWVKTLRATGGNAQKSDLFLKNRVENLSRMGRITKKRHDIEQKRHNFVKSFGKIVQKSAVAEQKSHGNVTYTHDHEQKSDIAEQKRHNIASFAMHNT